MYIILFFFLSSPFSLPSSPSLMKPVQPSTTQLVKPKEALPLLLTQPTSNEVTKDALVSSNQVTKEKEQKNKREDDLPFIDRSTTKLIKHL